MQRCAFMLCNIRENVHIHAQKHALSCECSSQQQVYVYVKGHRAAFKGISGSGHKVDVQLYILNLPLIYYLLALVLFIFHCFYIYSHHLSTLINKTGLIQIIYVGVKLVSDCV